MKSPAVTFAALYMARQLYLALFAADVYADSMKKPFSLEVIGTTDNPPLRDGQPLYLSPVEAGFPSPAEDHQYRSLDLHE